MLFPVSFIVFFHGLKLMSTPLFHFPLNYSQVAELNKLAEELLDPPLLSFRVAHA